VKRETYFVIRNTIKAVAQGKRNFVLNLKDMAMSALATPVLGKHIQPYGKLESLDINSSESQIAIQVLPRGEERSVTVTVGGCSITSVEGKKFFVWESVKVSRPWMQQLVENFLPEKRIAISSPAAAILKILNIA